MLEVRDLTVHYGRAIALKEVGLRVERGEIVTVIGPNGAGKTTLLRAISGLEKATDGEIYFEQTRITKYPPHKMSRLGLIHCPERRRLFPEMTVLENLQMGSYANRTGSEKRLVWVYELFPLLRERSSQEASTLSGGEQQMLAIGRALMSEPKLLMLDEPSVGLAPIVKQKIFEAIRQIHETGLTVLLVEQDVTSALNIADRGYVMERGQIRTEGLSRHLVRNPHVKELYLGVS